MTSDPFLSLVSHGSARSVQMPAGTVYRSRHLPPVFAETGVKMQGGKVPHNGIRV
ncbi:hypothetical protein [Enterobacter kobei]|uniref:hypothetical protein n=1 Tax=Enterobacter kobei TaxID=208224 RepID=UPI000A71D2FE|nr:hypothetical protein [Enterobacter kobei]